ncbi:MAG: hypothetical protein ACK4VY_00830 [Brevundimonas sp.]
MIDLTEQQIAALAEIGREEKKSRAALVREGVEALIEDYRRRRDDAALDAVVGIWKDDVEDGVEYQRRLRAEWDEVDERIEQRLIAAGE